MSRPRMHRRVGVTVAALCLAVAACGTATDGGADEPLLVSAAADLMPAFTELGERFETTTGEEVVFSFGSSGQLAQQLIEGAPMDLYASASAAFVDQVLDAGVGDADTRHTYAFGRLAVWATSDAWRGWQDLDALADDERVRTIAIANPDHAPYGLAAMQALETVGLWEAVQPRLVYGENIADTQRLAATGNADVAIVSHSLALAADEDGDGAWILVDGALHEPLQQDLVVVAQDPDRAALAGRFVDHLTSDEGRRIMERFGFVLPDDESAEGASR